MVFWIWVSGWIVKSGVGGTANLDHESDMPNRMWVELRSGMSREIDGDPPESGKREGNASGRFYLFFVQFLTSFNQFYAQTYQMRPAN